MRMITALYLLIAGLILGACAHKSVPPSTPVSELDAFSAPTTPTTGPSHGPLYRRFEAIADRKRREYLALAALADDLATKRVSASDVVEFLRRTDNPERSAALDSMVDYWARDLCAESIELDDRAAHESAPQEIYAPGASRRDHADSLRAWGVFRQAQFVRRTDSEGRRIWNAMRGDASQLNPFAYRSLPDRMVFVDGSGALNILNARGIVTHIATVPDLTQYLQTQAPPFHDVDSARDLAVTWTYLHEIIAARGRGPVNTDFHVVAAYRPEGYEALIRIQGHDPRNPTDEKRFIMVFTPAGVMESVTESESLPPASTKPAER